MTAPEDKARIAELEARVDHLTDILHRVAGGTFSSGWGRDTRHEIGMLAETPLCGNP